MKKTKKLINVISTLLTISLLTFIMCMNFFPTETSRAVGFRMYTVLTDSMEPTIPTNSVIFTKVVDPSNKLILKKGDIITFNADRFGEEILITHRFNKMQKNNDDVWCYRTNPEKSKALDTYETKRSDIVGTYVFHIPYVGKFILFLQSKFGLLLYAELFLIWCVNKLIQAKWEEKEKNDKEENKIDIIDYSFEEVENMYQLYIYKMEGMLRSRSLLPKKNIDLEITCYDEEDQICYQEIHSIMKKRIYYRKKNYFTTKIHVKKKINRIEVKVVNIQKK